MVQIKGENSVDFGGSFQIPTPGKHLMMFVDDPLGIETPDGSEQERFVCQLEVIDDPNDSENGAQVRQSFPLDWDNSEELICNILTCAGVAADIEESVNNAHPDNNFSVFDDPVIEQIKLKLPDQVVSCITSIRKHKDREYGQIDHMEAINTQPAQSSKSSGRSSSTVSRRRS